MTLKQIKTIAYYLLLIPLILLAALFVGSLVPQIGNYQILTVLSGSMEPAIKTGSVIIISPDKDYEIGDIISFKPQNVKNLTTHRIKDIKIQNDLPIYLTQGDANPAPDIWEVRQEEIIGKTIFSLPYLGYGAEFVKKPVGFILAVILPAIVVIGGEIKKIYQALKKKNYAKNNG